MEVVGRTGGSLIDDHRGGTFATASVTVSAAGADALVKNLTGRAIGVRDPNDAVRFALNAERIGGVVSRDPITGNIGLAQLTEGVVERLGSSFVSLATLRNVMSSGGTRATPLAYTVTVDLRAH